jgi:hypothetical protein
VREQACAGHHALGVACDLRARVTPQLQECACALAVHQHCADRPSPPVPRGAT